MPGVAYQPGRVDLEQLPPPLLSQLQGVLSIAMQLLGVAAPNQPLSLMPPRRNPENQPPGPPPVQQG